MIQSIAVGVIVAAAVVAAVVWFVRSLRGENSCASCAHAGECPFAKNGQCPSDESNTTQADETKRQV